MHSHLKIAVESIRCFTDDGRLDVAELNYLLGIATADGNVDDDEKRVLVSIMSKAIEAGADRRTEERIRDVMKKFGAE
ncbi:MAG: hypothetical protein MI919_34095 [Holophagales bacterium]|nr:hypothetical protein [Holophagales bacterium]